MKGVRIKVRKKVRKEFLGRKLGRNERRIRKEGTRNK
jgi:hypothetical protein